MPSPKSIAPYACQGPVPSELANGRRTLHSAPTILDPDGIEIAPRFKVVPASEPGSFDDKSNNPEEGCSYKFEEFIRSVPDPEVKC